VPQPNRNFHRQRIREARAAAMPGRPDRDTDRAFAVGIVVTLIGLAVMNTLAGAIGR
jgi:hypothetical protein